MKKKITGVCTAVLLLAAAAVWSSQSGREKETVSEKEIQTERTAQNRQTQTESLTDKEKTQEEESGSGEKQEKESQTQQNSLIETKKKKDAQEEETQEQQYQGSLIRRKQTEGEKVTDPGTQETEEEIFLRDSLIRRKNPSDTQPQPETAEAEWPHDDQTEPQLQSETEAQGQTETEKQSETEANRYTYREKQSEAQTEGQSETEKEELSIFVSASLGETADEIKKAYEERNPDISVVLSAQEDAVLYGEAEDSETYDVYLSSSLEVLETLAREGKVEEESIQAIAEDPVVLIQTYGGDSNVTGFDQMLEAQDFALAQEDTSLGKASREVLESAGIYEQVKEMDVSEVGNADAVMAAVSTRSSELGIVYGTDAARAQGLVEVIAEAPEESVSEPVRYYCGTGSKTDGSRAENRGKASEFLAYLDSEEAADILKKYGLSCDQQP